MRPCHGGLGAQGANEAQSPRQPQDMPALGADEHQPIIPENLPNLNQPATPPLHENHVHGSSDPPTDPIATLQSHLAAIIDNANDLIARLGGTIITGASCEMVEFTKNDGILRKYIPQFDVVETSSSVIAPTEIIPLPYEESVKVIQKNKMNKKELVEVGLVRRSVRIAKTLGGYKDVASANAAGFIPVSDDTCIETENSEDLLITNLAPRFDVLHVMEMPRHHLTSHLRLSKLLELDDARFRMRRCQMECSSLIVLIIVCNLISSKVVGRPIIIFLVIPSFRIDRINRVLFVSHSRTILAFLLIGIEILFCFTAIIFVPCNLLATVQHMSKNSPITHTRSPHGQTANHTTYLSMPII
jgi:hypothetical protein